MRDVLILLEPEGMEAIDRIIEAIEEMRGRVLLTYAPHAIVASVPDEAIDNLRDKPRIRSVDTEEIADDRVRGEPEAVRVAVAAWNEHLARQRRPREEPVGLSWDAPGRLPPDPPRHIREMLRRRERELGTDSDDPDSQ